MSDFNVRYSFIQCESILGRLIRNPHYGGPSVSLNGWRYKTSISNHTKPGFQAALESSIRSEGVRNPILVWTLPEGTFLVFGGSRLRAAREAGLDKIPALINDYTGKYKLAPRVTPKNIKNYFKDPPREFDWTDDGVDYHYNLERARRHEHDTAGFAWLEGETPSFIAEEFPWLLED